MIQPYYADDQVALYLGRFEDVLPQLDVQADLLVADPPYGETTLPWDRWPVGWPALAAAYAESMWVFGSMRMFLDRRDEFEGWHMSQDIVWEKHNGSGLHADRFKRVHEHAGSCSTLEAARMTGRRGIAVEVREAQCEKSARRLSQQLLDLGGVS